MSKRGLSHVEAIVSFILFVGFLFLAFYFFSPFQGNNRVLDSSLDYTINEITKNATSQTEIYALSFTPDVNDLTVILTVRRILENVNMSVLNYSGDILNSMANGNDLTIGRSSNYHIRIIFSEGITETHSLVSLGRRLPPENYTVSSSEIVDIVSESKLLQLNSTYHSDYEGLKREFNIPNRVDFAFEIEFDDKRITAEREVPAELEVVAKEERIEVIRNDGKIEFADLRVRVW